MAPRDAAPPPMPMRAAAVQPAVKTQPVTQVASRRSSMRSRQLLLPAVTFALAGLLLLLLLGFFTSIGDRPDDVSPWLQTHTETAATTQQKQKNGKKAPRRMKNIAGWSLAAEDMRGDFLERQDLQWDDLSQVGDFGRQREALVAVNGTFYLRGDNRVDMDIPLEETKCPEQTAPAPAPLDDSTLRVYMYDLPVDFNWGLLNDTRRPTLRVFGPGLFESDSFPDHSDRRWSWGGCPGNYSASVPVYASNPSAQQHSVAYFMLLSLIQGLSSIRRVAEPENAQVFFVPYFSAMSYNRDLRKPNHRDAILQQELVEWLQKQEPWKRSGGRDHVIVTHHPNALELRMNQVKEAIFVVSDFSRPAIKGSYYEKDVVAPYKAFVSPFSNDCSNSTASWDARPSMLFFQGGFKRKKGGYIREKLKEVLEGEEGVMLVESRPTKTAIQEAAQGFQRSKFCLMPAGDTPSSCRLFDAIMSHCIPVIVSQALELPYEDILDYSEFAVFVPTYKAITPGYMMNLLRNVSRTQWETMHQRLQEVRHMFQYDHPAVIGGAEDMIWQAVARKIQKIPPSDYREKRLLIQEREQDPASKYL